MGSLVRSALVLLAFFACFSGFGRGQCDVIPPALTNLEMVRTEVDVTERASFVYFYVEATDELSGLSSIRIQLVPPSSKKTEVCERHIEGFGTTQSGRYQCFNFALRAKSEPGIWIVESVELTDVANRTSITTYSELVNAGFETELDVTSVPDGQAPVLNQLQLLPSASVDVSQSSQLVRCSMDVTDDVSGVRGMRCELNAPSSGQRAACDRIGVGLQEVTECWLRIPQHAEPGSWLLTMTVFDLQGNERTYDPGALAAEGLPNAVAVTSAAPDVSPPALLDFDVDAVALNVEATDQTVTCSARLADSSSVRDFTCKIAFDGPNDPLEQSCTSTEPVSGASMDGTWSCKLRIPQYTQEGAFDVSIEFSDIVTNSTSFSSSALSSAGFSSSFDTVCGSSGFGLSPRLTYLDKQAARWNSIPEAQDYEVYGRILASFDDTDADGLLDGGYGDCRTAEDPDSTDTEFPDLNPVPPGQFGFLIVSYNTLTDTGLGPGVTSAELQRAPSTPCP